MNKLVFKTGRQAIEALPASLRVGPFNFRIEKLSAQRAMGKDCFGEFSSCEGQLALQLDMPSAVKAADTMLHEAGHAIYATYALAEDDKEERVVAAANAAHALPLQNLQQYQSLLTPLAQLGSQTSGTSQGTTTQSVPLSQQIIGGAVGGLGLLGALGGLPTAGMGGGLLGGIGRMLAGGSSQGGNS